MTHLHEHEALDEFLTGVQLEPLLNWGPSDSLPDETFMAGQGLGDAVDVSTSERERSASMTGELVQREQAPPLRDHP